MRETDKDTERERPILRERDKLMVFNTQSTTQPWSVKFTDILNRVYDVNSFSRLYH